MDSVRIGGFSGSIKYKPDDYYSMFTNEESEETLSALPSCNILVTHDKPCFGKPENITFRSGLTGIASYIKRNNPALVFHGHIHEKSQKRYGDTIIRCCYRVESFKIYI